jgi:hypothetical protein
MAENIRDFDISRTYDNVLLTQVTGEPDTDGIPTGTLPLRRTGNMSMRDQGRVQDGFGTEAPLVVTEDVIEIESPPTTAFSPIRRADVVGLHASMFIHNLIWN